MEAKAPVAKNLERKCIKRIIWGFEGKELNLQKGYKQHNQGSAVCQAWDERMGFSMWKCFEAGKKSEYRGKCGGGLKQSLMRISGKETTGPGGLETKKGQVPL